MTVKIYSTTTCPFCKMEKEYLDSKEIKYENIFVDQDPKAADEMVKISGQLGVPFTIITRDDGTKEQFLGYDKAKLDQALGLKDD